MPIENTATGWKLPPDEMAAQARLARLSYNATYMDYFGTTTPERVALFADISLDASKNINASCAVRWVAALAKEGLCMQIIVGHGSRVFITPDVAVSLFQSSLVNGKSCMSFATKELQEASDPLLYLPIMAAAKAAASLSGQGIPPTKMMLSFKGAVLTGMTGAQFAELAKFGDQAILGAENSNVQ